jgi:pimeloyl-ACP methyl ester carboxylesterase
MGIITAADGTEIFYKDWGAGQPVVFSHGWPLTADAWDDQLFLVASNGYRAIAGSRLGQGAAPVAVPISAYPMVIHCCSSQPRKSSARG